MKNNYFNKFENNYNYYQQNNKLKQIVRFDVN